MYLSVTKGATVVIGVGNPAFRFSQGESFPATIFVDGRPPFHARASAFRHDFATLEITEFERGMTAIQRGNVMRFVSDKFTGEYGLKGTSGALDKALQCAIDNLEYTEANSKPQGNYRSNIEQATFYQLATQMITIVGADDFQYLSEAEIEGLGFSNGVFWKSEAYDLLGGTLVLPLTEPNLQKSDASDIAFLSGLCNGDFASQAKAITTSGMEQREVSGFCIEGAEKSQFVALKTKFGDEVLYNIMFFGSNAPSEATERSELTGNVALKAASFAAEN